MNKRSIQSLNSQSDHQSQTKKPKFNISITASLHIKCFGSKNPVEFIDLEPRKPTPSAAIAADAITYSNILKLVKHIASYTLMIILRKCLLLMVLGLGRVSLNGVFVDGVRVGNGESKELHTGSEVSVVCGSCFRVGFVVEKIVFSDSKLAYAGLLSRKCREILSSDDPVLYIRKCFGNTARCGSRNRVKSNSRFTPDKVLDICNNKRPCLSNVRPSNRDTNFRDNCIDLELNAELLRCNVNGGNLEQLVNVDDRVPLRGCNSSEKRSDKYTCEEIAVQSDQVLKPRKRGVCVPPPGSNFYLNRLHFMDDGQSGSDEVNVTLPELLYPVETLERGFYCNVYE